MTEMKARIDANLFRLCWTAVSTEETPYYLNGVHIEPHPEAGAILVSTDGHRLIVAHDPDGTCDCEMIVSLPRFALAQCKPPRMFTARRLLEIDADLPGSATIVDETEPSRPEDGIKREQLLTVHRVIVDGTYPDWRKVVPEMPAGKELNAPIGFNGKYLHDFAMLGMDMTKTIGTGGKAFTIYQKSPSDPVLCRWSGIDNIFAVLMPMRIDATPELPKFMVKEKRLQAA